MTPVALAPSILSADFARLGEQVAEVEAAGADRIHVDVMDGHFVPNITIGPVVVRSLRRVTRLPLEAHLMIAEPDRYLATFADAGADGLIVHVEGAVHLHRTLESIGRLGKRVGLDRIAYGGSSAVSFYKPNCLRRDTRIFTRVLHQATLRFGTR